MPTLARFSFHKLPQRRVDTQLIPALPAFLRFAPMEQVGVEAEGDLLFERAVEFAAHGVLPVELSRGGGGIDILFGIAAMRSISSRCASVNSGGLAGSY